MLKKVKKAKQVESIDISPLIDMVFILLIFFMVSTTFVKDFKVDINRPGASSSERASTKSIRVFIDKHRNIFLDGQPIRLWVLSSKLKDLLRVGSEKSVLVVTDKEVSAERLIEVVDQCRMAGAKDIGVATETET